MTTRAGADAWESERKTPDKYPCRRPFPGEKAASRTAVRLP